MNSAADAGRDVLKYLRACIYNCFLNRYKYAGFISHLFPSHVLLIIDSPFRPGLKTLRPPSWHKCFFIKYIHRR